LHEISGTYLLSKQYSLSEDQKDTIQLYSRTDASQLNGYCKHNFNAISHDSLLFNEMVTSQFNYFDSLYSSKRITINTDSTFILCDYYDTVKGKIMMLEDIHTIWLKFNKVIEKKKEKTKNDFHFLDILICYSRFKDFGELESITANGQICNYKKE
jgi:hypothetical protein